MTKLTEKFLQKVAKKKKLNDDYWYELKAGGFTIITNDTLHNEGKDEWNLGFIAEDGQMDDYYWNGKWDTEEKLKELYHCFTDKELISSGCTCPNPKCDYCTKMIQENCR